MRMHLVTLLVLTACGKDAGGSADGSISGTCNPSCVEEQRWWLATSSNCTVICMATPSLAECMQSDCKAIEATRYVSAERTSLAPLLYSASSHSFYLLGSASTAAYVVMDDCTLQIGSNAPTPFMCVAAGLQLPTATLEPATSAQNTALDMAAASGAVGRYTYQ